MTRVAGGWMAGGWAVKTSASRRLTSRKVRTSAREMMLMMMMRDAEGSPLSASV